MTLEEIVAYERQRYVKFYVDAKRAHATVQKNTVGELLISIKNEALPYPYRYMRVDLISNDDNGSPQISEVVLEPNLAFEPKGFSFGSFQVEVYPFAWCRVQIAFDKPPASVQQIEGFITRWLDVEDKNEGDPDGVHGAIHSATQIETDGTWWFLTADFGTAPPDVLIELIELLAGQGMSRIILQAG